MSDRRLIVGEFDPAEPDHGKMFGLQPNNATGVAVPAFRYGAIRPAVGSVAGEGFIETGTGVASVWDGNQWTQIAVPVVIQHPTENDLLQTTPNDGTVALSRDNGQIFSRVNGDWLALGIRMYPTAAALAADAPPDGTTGFAADSGQFYVRTGGVWATLTQQNVTVGNQAPATPAAGEQWLEPQSSTLWTYDGQNWLPPSGGIPTGTIIQHASWAPPIGFLRCDGGAIPAGTQYDALKQMLGGQNTPDLTDQFIRGASSQAEMLSRHNDTTRRPRSSAFTGTTNDSGRHRHRIDPDNRRTNWGSTNSYDDWMATWNKEGGSNTDYAGTHRHTVTINGGGDAETAPVHVRLAFHVKW